MSKGEKVGKEDDYKRFPFGEKPRPGALKEPSILADEPPLGWRQLLVLEAIQELGPNASGLEILPVLEKMTGRHLGQSAVYGPLTKMVDPNKGYVEVVETRPSQKRGPPLKIYRLTAKGEAAYEATWNHYQAMNNWISDQSHAAVPLSDFKAEVMVQGFKAFLEKYGSVSFGAAQVVTLANEHIDLRPRSHAEKSRTERIGVQKDVFVGGQKVGVLSLIMMKPRSLQYDGIVPITNQEFLSTIDESVVRERRGDLVWCEARLIYSFEPGDGGIGAGRTDGWDEQVPFP